MCALVLLEMDVPICVPCEFVAILGSEFFRKIQEFLLFCGKFIVDENFTLVTKFLFLSVKLLPRRYKLLADESGFEFDSDNR